MSTMNDVDTTDGVTKRAALRKHSAQFKGQVLEACSRPDASAAAIARLHDPQTNVVHRWRADRRKSVTRQAAGMSALPPPGFIVLGMQPEPNLRHSPSPVPATMP
ncbi:MAG: transposase [Burkholderiaceae bacterium]|nr:transposase [Burkholderiaceae bacterium]